MGAVHVGVGPIGRVDAVRKRVDEDHDVEELDEAENLLYEAYRLKSQRPCDVHEL